MKTLKKKKKKKQSSIGKEQFDYLGKLLHQQISFSEDLSHM